MRFRVAPRFDKLAQIRLTGLKRYFAKIASKQLVSQPDAIGVDDITFTIVGNLLDLAIEEVSLDLRPIHAFWLTWQAHDPTQLA